MPNPLRILLIDDDEDSFVLTRALLAQPGIQLLRRGKGVPAPQPAVDLPLPENSVG